MHAEIDQVSQALDRKLRSAHGKQHQIIHTTLQDTDKQRLVCSTLLNTAGQILDSADDFTMIREGRKLTTCLSERPKQTSTAKTSHTSALQFVEGSMATGDIEKMSGSVQNKRDVHVDGHVEVMSSFTTGDTSVPVNSIVPCSGYRCWIYQYGQFKLRLMDVHGRVVKTVDIGVKVGAMTGDPHGGLYVSCRHDTCIKYVSPQLEVSTVTTIETETVSVSCIVLTTTG
jgi:hypothetical protein